MLRHARIEFAHPQPAFAVLLELVGTCQQFLFASVKNVRETSGFDRFLEGFGHRFPCELLQLRLVIERVHLRWTADHEKKDHRLRSRCEMRLPRGEWIERIYRRPFWRRSNCLPLQ